MLEILFGSISGIISGMGMGGGTFLIFFLTYFLQVNQYVAQSVNLIYFIPASITSVIVNYKNKNIDFKIAIYISLIGIIGAFLGVKLSLYINVFLLRKIFGLFLLIIGIYEIYTLIKENKKVKKAKNKKRKDWFLWNLQKD